MYPAAVPAGTPAKLGDVTGDGIRILLTARSCLRLILGVIAYPAASVLVLHGLSGSAIDAVSITVLGLPGLAIGALVRRIWIVGVPLAGAVIWLLVAYAMDPSCTTTCGSDDTWTVLVLMTMIYLVIPAMFSLLLGSSPATCSHASHHHAGQRVASGPPPNGH